MTLITAKSAGFCMGVAKAVNTVYQQMREQKLVTYGSLIHNKTVTDDLAAQGVRIIHDLSEVQDETVVIRSHGVPPVFEEEMKQRGIAYIDCTCACVKAVHRYAAQSRDEGSTLIVLGEATHPEIVGIVGYAGERCLVVKDENDPALKRLDKNGRYRLTAQTTSQRLTFQQVAALLEEQGLAVTIHDTICNATSLRQAEAEALSKEVDVMLVLGDEKSANTQKLFNISKNHCEKTVLLQSIHDLQLQMLSANDKIGITAGASTPPAITKEAIQFMSDLVNTVDEQTTQLEQGNQPQTESPLPEEGAAQPEKLTVQPSQAPQSFEDMLNESFITLHTGDVVKGTVIHVSSGEVTVNLGYKSDGIITKAEMSDDPSVDITQMVKQGDVIDVYVIRVNDGDGNVLVSKKKLDAQVHYKLLEQAFNDKTPIAGKVLDVVKGGLIVTMHGNRVFVPSSQISNRYVDDLSVFKGKEFNFNILEFDRSKRRIVAGRKELAATEQQQKRDALFASLTVGQRLEGAVSRIVDFGAFVDLGGVDGLVHISELAWRRVRRVTDVLQVGDKVTVTVIDVNPEKNKISLTLKDINNNPWNNITEKYPVGSIVEGKVVRMAAFGAFVMLEDGVDGLVHISQIANKHVNKPEDELTVGEYIQVKVTDIDEANKKISLSKREADYALQNPDGDDAYDDDYEEDHYQDDWADENEETEE